VHREGALDADTEADLADREGLADAVALDADDRALEDLDARTAALDDLDVHLEGVAGPEGGDVVAQAGGVEGVEDVNGWSLSRRCHGSPTGLVGLWSPLDRRVCLPRGGDAAGTWRERLVCHSG